MDINLVNKIRESKSVIETLNPPTKFSTDVQLYLYMDNYGYNDYDHSRTITINFTIDEEWRSWGLKSLLIIPDPVSIPVTVITRTDNDDEGEAKDITIQANISPIPMTSIPTIIRSLEVSCDKDNNVKEATLYTSA